MIGDNIVGRRPQQAIRNFNLGHQLTELGLDMLRLGPADCLGYATGQPGHETELDGAANNRLEQGVAGRSTKECSWKPRYHR